MASAAGCGGGGGGGGGGRNGSSCADGGAAGPACEWPWVASVEFAGRESDLGECSTNGVLVEAAYTACAAVCAVVVLQTLAKSRSRGRLLRNLPILLCFGVFAGVCVARSAWVNRAGRPLFGIDAQWTVLTVLSFVLFAVNAAILLSKYLCFIRAQSASVLPHSSTRAIKLLITYSRVISAAIAIWIGGCVLPLAALTAYSSDAGERIAYLRACLAAWGLGLACECLFFDITFARVLAEFELNCNIMEAARGPKETEISIGPVADLLERVRKLRGGIRAARVAVWLSHGLFCSHLLLGAIFPSATRLLAYLHPLAALASCLLVMICNIVLVRPKRKARASTVHSTAHRARPAGAALPRD
jgi:hypothetical protein